jgi:RNA polymerase-binding transcription factor DksA
MSELVKQLLELEPRMKTPGLRNLMRAAADALERLTAERDRLKAALEQAQAELDEVRRGAVERVRLHIEEVVLARRERDQRHAEALDASNTATNLRAALEQVERDEYGHCLWCGAFEAHTTDCPRQLALRGEGREGPDYIEVRSSACHAGSDGDCDWPDCPQTRDGEPEKSGRDCPLLGIPHVHRIGEGREGAR